MTKMVSAPSPNGTNYAGLMVPADFLKMALDAAPAVYPNVRGQMDDTGQRTTLDQQEGEGEGGGKAEGGEGNGNGSNWRARCARFLLDKGIERDSVLEALKLIDLGMRNAHLSDDEMPKPATEGGMGGRTKISMDRALSSSEEEAFFREFADARRIKSV
jgi:hypothetical protein